MSSSAILSEKRYKSGKCGQEVWGCEGRGWRVHDAEGGRPYRVRAEGRIGLGVAVGGGGT